MAKAFVDLLHLKTDPYCRRQYLGPALEHDHPAKRKVIVHHVLLTPELATQVVQGAALGVDVVEVEGGGRIRRC